MLCYELYHNVGSRRRYVNRPKGTYRPTKCLEVLLGVST